MNQDEAYELILDLVRSLSCDELRLWLRTCKGGRDPRRLPRYSQYETLFTDTSGITPGGKLTKDRHPAMHMMYLMTFDSLAEVRLFGDCAGGRH